MPSRRWRKGRRGGLREEENLGSDVVLKKSTRVQVSL